MKLDAFDSWLVGEKEQAILGKQQLESIDGKDGIVAPPTYPPPKDEKAPSSFLIDSIRGKDQCDLDSVPSQANRIEPLFATAPYNTLVPQLIINKDNESFNALTFAHRIAEGAFFFSGANGIVDPAMNAAKAGNCLPLAKLSPTSILFGFWNSQHKKRDGVDLKVTRAFKSSITAYDVEVVNRNSVYVSAVPEIIGRRALDELGIEENSKDSEIGAANAIGSKKQYGIISFGGIYRNWYLGLPQIRALKAPSEKETLSLRRYILSLGLLSFLFDQPTLLRSGCHLLPLGEPSLTLRSYRTCTDFALSFDDAYAFATAAASDFGVGADMNFQFSIERLKEARKKNAAEKAIKKGG